MKSLVLLVLAASLLHAQEAPAGKPGGSMIFLRDYGTDDIGYLVVPEKEPRAGVVVLPDRQGVTADFKRFCEKLAGEGFIVLGLDLYNGRVAKDEAEAAQMGASLQEKNFSKTLRTGLKFFESSPRFQMEKKMLIACGASGNVTVKSLLREKGPLALVLLDTPVVERGLLQDLRIPFQILCSPTGESLQEFRLMEAELSGRLRNNFELRVVQGGAYIEPIKAFFHRILTDPPKQSLIDKIF